MRNYLWIVIGTLSLFAVSLAQAQMPDLSKLTKEQVNALPPDVVNRLPFRELFKKHDNLSDRAINLIIAGALNRLFYLGSLPASASISEIKAATAKFQRDINTPQTGQLLLGESTELFRRVEAQNIMPVYLPGSDNTKIDSSNQHVSVEGTWKIEGENMAWPMNKSTINTSTIRCWKFGQNCSVTDFQLVTESTIQQSMIFMSEETYHILKWDAREVVAEQSSDCRATTLTLNLATNEVFQITRNIGKEGCNLLPQPRITQLVSGKQISLDYWKARRDEANSFLSREHQLAIKELEQFFK